MANLLALILMSVFIVSLVSFVGVLTLLLRQAVMNNLLFMITAFAAGTLLGAALLDLIPEAIEAGESAGLEPVSILVYVIVGILTFYSIERFISWHHHHHREMKSVSEEQHKEMHAFTYLSLIGDGVHNFLDGMIIAASFLTNVPLGIATTVAIALHEIPQEIGDFALLIYGGFSRTRALLYNFLSALTAVAGGVAGYFFLDRLAGLTLFLLAFAAGGFLYIANADLIPELHKETGIGKSIIQFISMVAGIVLIFAIISTFGG